MERLIEKQHARLDKERQERDKQEKERQEKLLATISISILWS